jgi:hypothetical protein
MKAFSIRCVLRLHLWRIDQYRNFMPYRRTCKRCGQVEVFAFGSWEVEPP